jgi:hypothetical protein
MLQGINKALSGMRGGRKNELIDEYIVAAFNCIEKAIHHLNYEYCDEIVEPATIEMEDK